MFLGTGRTSSVTHAAGPRAAGSARPKALVVLVNTKRDAGGDRLLQQVQRARDVGIDEILPACVPTCGLCRVAVCRTASTPAMQRRTIAVGDRADNAA